MKNYILIILVLAITKISFSQDIIKLKNGEEIKAKVTEIGAKNIKYKKYDFQEGPNYTILKTNTSYILYENGTKDSFQGDLSTIDAEMLYKRKLNQYQKTKKIGTVLGAAGALGIIALSTNLSSINEDNAVLFVNGYSLGFTAIIGGAVLYFNSNRKIRQYSGKLSKLNVGLSLSKTHNGFSISYRF